jgi:hypothetical protein
MDRYQASGSNRKGTRSGVVDKTRSVPNRAGRSVGPVSGRRLVGRRACRRSELIGPHEECAQALGAIVRW